MRVLFVWLNNDTAVGLSHGIALLSSELKSAGHHVDINELLGTPLDEAVLVNELRNRAADVVALSFGSNHASAARLVVRLTRHEQPGSWVVCGGIHTTMYPEDVIRWPEVDVLALGESDGLRFVRLLEDLEIGRFPSAREGFWFRRGDLLVRNSLAPPVDLTQHPGRVDFELFDHRQILRLKRGWADTHAGRGCPHRCTYCFNEPLRKRYLRALRLPRGGELNYVRKRPLDAVLAELFEYQKRHGEHIRAFSFTDDQFLIGRDWTHGFFDAYAELDRPLVFLATAGSVNESIAQRAGRAGTYMVRMGVESGSEALRKRVLNRHTPNSVIRRAVHAVQSAGINAFSFNMLGIPEETLEDAWNTLRFAAELRWDALKFSLFWPYPGTALHESCVLQGLIRDDQRFVGNNTDDTPLHWAPRQQRFYRRISRFFDAALNQFLPEREAPHFAAIVEELNHLDDAPWRDHGAQELRHRADQLVGEAMARGGFVYSAPFPDRRDIVLLQGRARERPLLM